MRPVNEPRPQQEVGEGLSRARIERRFVANSGLIIAARIVTACLSLAVVPVLVFRFGVAGYGTWEALLALATLTSIFQTAISGTLVWRISEAYGKAQAAGKLAFGHSGQGSTNHLAGELFSIMSGIKKLPNAPARTGMITRKIITVACMVNSIVYVSGAI